MRTLFITTTLMAAWLAMQLVHETGHVLGAWLTGGTIERVSLHPLSLSRTDVSPNPQPLVVVWLGPLVGSALPLIAWGLSCVLGWSQSFLLRFFAGFCLVANGAYIGVGSLDRVGDCDEMMRHGTPMVVLWGFGLITIALGFTLWHGQGGHFGLGKDRESIATSSLITVISVTVTLLTVGFLVGQ